MKLRIVIEITDNEVKLKCGKYEFELPMKKLSTATRERLKYRGYTPDTIELKHTIDDILAMLYRNLGIGADKL